MLKKFNAYINLNEDVLLSEALNNPKEYYMTDDTVLPSKMYGATTINGGTYIISLVEQNGEGIYTLEVGKVKKIGGKVGWWKFHNSLDILPVIATTLDFAKKATTVIGPKLTGIAIRLYGQIGKRKVAERIAIKALKKSSMNIFKVFQVSQVGEKQFTKKYNHGYVFIGKKALSPEVIFKSKEFKEFGFDPSKKDNSDALLKSLDSMKPKTSVKKTHTVAPSKKYTFGQYDLDVPSDTDALDRLATAKVSDEVTKHIEKQMAVDKLDTEAVFNPTHIPKVGQIANAIRTIPQFAKMVDALQDYGFNEQKVNFTNLQHVYSQMTLVNKEIVDTLASSSLGPTSVLPGANLGMTNVKHYQKIWIEILKYVAFPISVDDEYHMEAIIDYRNSKIADNIEALVDKKTKKTKINKLDVDMSEFKSTMPGAGTGGVTIEDGYFVESEDYDAYTIIKYMQDGPDAYAETTGLNYYEEIKKLPKSIYKSATAYSGSGFGSFNGPLRHIISKLLANAPISKDEIAELTTSGKKIAKLARAFENIKPLPESLYVYRSTHVPYKMKDNIVPGYEYCDAAFLSTSIRPTLGFGGKDKMRIFLPKGTKVLPILEHSVHASEQEIILPPTSVIKIVEVEERKDDDVDRLFIQGVYTGFAFKSIVKSLKKQLTEAVKSRRILLSLQRMIAMSEEKKEESYNPDEKFGGTYDASLADLMTKAIKRGEFDLDSPVDPAKKD